MKRRPRRNTTVIAREVRTGQVHAFTLRGEKEAEDASILAAESLAAEIGSTYDDIASRYAFEVICGTVAL